MKKILRNENLQNEIMKKGYAVVPLLSAEEIAFLLNKVKENLPNENNLFDANGSLVSNGYHVTFLDSDVEYKKRASKLVQDFFAPLVEKLFIDYRILTGGFYVKPAGSDEISIHRDLTFTNNFNDVNITIWCPLVDVDETNGALLMVEGSHKLVPGIMTILTKPFFSEYEDWLKENSKIIRLKVGEVLLFDNTILHGSSRNGSGKMRYAVNMLCIHQTAQTVYYYPDKIDLEKKFEVYQIDQNFLESHTSQDFFAGNLRGKSLGYVENKNQTVTQSEFEEMLKNGDEIRTNIYFPEEQNTKRTLLSSLKAAFGLSK